MFFFPKNHDQIIETLRGSLVLLGFSSRQIVIHSQLQLVGVGSFDADVAVIANDQVTILFQFEIKLGNGDPGVAYERAKKGLRGLWHHHRCFAVTTVGETIQMAEVSDEGDEKWIPLNEADRVAELLGDPKEEAARQVARTENRRRETVTKNCKSLLWWIGVVGGTTLVSAIVGELFGKELSWKIYYLLTLVLGMIAAAHGLVFYVKVGDGEVRIVDRGKTVGEVVPARGDAKDESETDVTS